MFSEESLPWIQISEQKLTRFVRRPSSRYIIVRCPLPTYLALIRHCIVETHSASNAMSARPAHIRQISLSNPSTFSQTMQYVWFGTQCVCCAFHLGTLSWPEHASLLSLVHCTNLFGNTSHPTSSSFWSQLQHSLLSTNRCYYIWHTIIPLLIIAHFAHT